MMNWNITSTQCVLLRLKIPYLSTIFVHSPVLSLGPQMPRSTSIMGFKVGRGDPLHMLLQLERPATTPLLFQCTHHCPSTHTKPWLLSHLPNKPGKVSKIEILKYRKQGSLTCCHKQISKWTYSRVRCLPQGQWNIDLSVFWFHLFQLAERTVAAKQQCALS